MRLASLADYLDDLQRFSIRFLFSSPGVDFDFLLHTARGSATKPQDLPADFKLIRDHCATNAQLQLGLIWTYVALHTNPLYTYRIVVPIQHCNSIKALSILFHNDPSYHRKRRKSLLVQTKSRFTCSVCRNCWLVIIVTCLPKSVSFSTILCHRSC